MPKPRVTVLPVDGSSARVQSFAGPTASVGPTFVLLHGIGMSHRYFRKLQQQLSTVGTVHTIDLPGYGASGHPKSQMLVPANAAVLAAALDRIGVTSCVVIGHSMGAQFATELSILRPDLVSHLVLIGPVVDPKRPTALHYALPMMLDSALETPGINWIEFSDYLRCGPRWYFAQLAAMFEYSLADRIPAVTRPVLVLRGSRDPLATEGWCTELAARAPSGRSASIPGGAHVVQYSRAARVAAAVIRFTMVGA